MAYRYAMLAVAACEARFAYAEALTWLDFAAAAAAGPEDMDTVNRTTARLLENAGLHEPPRVALPPVAAGRLGVADFDLPARV
jgi:hypothetical protein